MNTSLFKSRRFRQGMLSSAVTLLFIAVLVAVNGVTTILSDRYALYMDLTPTKMFTLSQQSKEYISDLEQEVQIYVLNTEENFAAVNEYYTQANEVLRNYQRLNPEKIKLQYVDIVREDPNFVSNFPDLQIGSNSVIVACEDRRQSLSPYDLFNVESSYYGMGGTYITASKAEQTVTSAILRVTSGQTGKAVLLTGHNETELGSLESLLTLNNYTVAQQNLITEDLAADADIAVIAGPKLDYTPEQLQKLDAFLEGGTDRDKTLLYFASPEQPELPNLEAFLAEWGLQLEPGVVYQTDANRAIQSPYFSFVDYINGKASEEGAASNIYASVPYARPMSIAFEKQNNIGTQVLLAFANTAVAQPLDAGADWQPQSAATGRSIPALAMGQRVSYPGETPRYSTVMVCTSTVAVDQALLEQSYFSNSSYFLNVINELARRETTLVLESKSLGGQTLGITLLQVVLISLVLIVVIPLGLLITGITVWLRRRHR